jgi:hypothetical protein
MRSAPGRLVWHRTGLGRACCRTARWPDVKRAVWRRWLARAWLAVTAVMLALAFPGLAAAQQVTPGSFGSDVQLTGVYADGHTVVAVGSDGRIITSTDDGLTWTAVSSPVGINLRGVAYGGGRWMAVGDAGVGATSTNGLDWSKVTLPKAGYRAITFNSASQEWIAGGFVSPLNNGIVEVSTDNGQTWAAAPVEHPGVFWGATSYGPLSILTGNYGELLLTQDGRWQRVVAPVKIITFEGAPIGRAFLWQVVRGTPGYVAVGSNGQVVFSQDGLGWIAVPTPLTQVLRGVAYGDGKYVAVGEDGQIGVSSNGLQWAVDQNVPTVEDLRSVAFTGDAVIAVGDYGQVLRSTNGVNWTLVLSGAQQQLSSVA